MLPQFKEIFEDCIVSDEETWKKKTITEFEWEFYNKDGVYQIIKLYKIPLISSRWNSKGHINARARNYIFKA